MFQCPVPCRCTSLSNMNARGLAHLCSTGIMSKKVRYFRWDCIMRNHGFLFCDLYIQFAKLNHADIFLFIPYSICSAVPNKKTPVTAKVHESRAICDNIFWTKPGPVIKGRANPFSKDLENGPLIESDILRESLRARFRRGVCFAQWDHTRQNHGWYTLVFYYTNEWEHRVQWHLLLNAAKLNATLNAEEHDVKASCDRQWTHPRRADRCVRNAPHVVLAEEKDSALLRI